MSAETVVLQNRLAAETSPYLLQHAGNPVQWQPWDARALAAARELDRPILLSIGYSACHWCHVMAHESFEHDETAALMNELFVNIKVDREERPDLDRVYQAAHQMLAQRGGGWPLTMILAPDDLTPFFAGTYFPREPRFGVPAFRDMLTKVHAAWRDNPEQIREQNKQLQNVFRQLDDAAIGQEFRLTDMPLLQSRRQLEAVFDPDNGGFQGSPKFPQAPNLAMLFQHGVSESDRPAERLALFTLQRMAERGLYDHLGGGFFRYCVDAEWEIPHFEKMLYDNGLLLTLYARGWNISKEDRFRDVLTRTADWAMHDMQSPAGGYFSSLDADSDGVEGAFYTWTREDVREAVGDHPDAGQLLHVANRYFGFDAEPNFGKQWHINIGDSMETIANDDGLALESVREMIDHVSARLLDYRELRIHPQRDEKILTSWNALMIKGMTAAAKALKQDEWYRSASQAMDFIMNECWDEQQLYACWKDEKARFPAYLDDHAFLIDAIMELLSYEWRHDYLNFAVSLADRMLEDFEDKKHGGFFFTTTRHDNPVKRMRIFNDDATPSGNGIGARGLLRLGRLLGETRYLDAAEKTLRAGWTAMSQSPYAHAGMLLALREYLADPPTVIIRGDMHIARIWLERLRNDIPTMSQIFALPELDHALPETLRDKKLQGNCVAYVCRGFTCSEPITDRDRLHDALTNAI